MSDVHSLDRPISLVAVLGCVILGIALSSEQAVTALALDPIGIVGGEWWRLWSAHLAHYSLSHAMMNALVLWVAGGIVEIRMGSRWLATRLLIGAPLISLVLLLCSPDLLEYRGLSALGVCLTVVAIICVARESPKFHVAIAVLAVALAAKLLGDSQGISLNLGGLPEDVVVDWRAHVVGALAGVCIALFSLHSTANIRHDRAALVRARFLR
jgi:rhomboid family GlyGly-CTERM serine protease